MPAITIRNLPEAVHTALKHRAAREKLSVEALVRRLLATEMLAPRQVLEPSVAYITDW